MRLCILRSRRFVDPGPMSPTESSVSIEFWLDRSSENFYFSVEPHAELRNYIMGGFTCGGGKKVNRCFGTDTEPVFLLDYSSWTLSILIPNHTGWDGRRLTLHTDEYTYSDGGNQGRSIFSFLRTIGFLMKQERITLFSF
jgi:hypothetical protein